MNVVEIIAGISKRSEMLFKPLTIAAFYFWTVLVSLLCLCGTPFLEAIRVSSVITIQMSTGSYFWLKFVDRQMKDVATLLGLGIGLGSILSLLFQQALRPWVPSTTSWLIPTCAALLHCLMNRQRNSSLSEEKLELDKGNLGHWSFFTCSFSCLLIALAYWWVWLSPLAIWSLLLVGICVFRQRISLFAKKNLWIWTSTFLLILSLGASLWLRNRQPFSWLFSNDQVFSESLSWSIVRFGPNESPFEAGASVRYHWLSLGWAGVVSDVSHASNFTVIAKALPISAFLATIALTWAILLNLNCSVRVRVLALYTYVFGMGLTGVTPIVRLTHSPTFMFGSVWLLTLVYVLMRVIKFFSWKLVAIYAILVFVTFGSKVTNGAIIFCGIALLVLSAFIFRSQSRSRYLIIFGITLLITLITYLVIFRSTGQVSNASNNDLFLDPGRIAADAGIINFDSSRLIKFFASIIFFGDFIFILTPVLFICFTDIRKRPEFWFLGAAALSGVIGTFVFGHYGASQLYFLYGSLLLSLILIAVYLDLEDFFSNQTPQILLFLFCWSVPIAIASKAMWVISKSRPENYQAHIILASTAILCIPVCVMQLILLTHFKYFRGTRLLRIKSFQMFSLSLIFVAILLGVGHRSMSIFEISTNPGTNILETRSSPNFILGSLDHQEALTWIRLNTDDQSIIATNRFCIPNVSPCISKWQIVSALSHRRMFIEGGYWVGGAPDVLTAEKVSISVRFAEAPSFVDWSYLVAGGVDYFFVDKSVGIDNTNWEPYATVVKSNNLITVLRMNSKETVSATQG